MLFKRYANPYPLLNGMISTGRLSEFVREFIKIHNEEQEEETIWEYWLHKVFDKSLADFKASIKQEPVKAAPTQTELKETISASFDMLNGFSLGGGADGVIQAVGNNSD